MLKHLPKIKIVCVLYTVDTPKYAKKFKVLYHHWGQYCDKFIGFSNSTRLENTVKVDPKDGKIFVCNW